ncbi:MAG: GGDEF domain-containing protein [Lachnospiraceae bacterium]|nr:GGDEF domain-containing protein [Lachnospiraceae bacterium]
MGDSKTKKSAKLTWVIIAIAFTAVIFILLNSVLSNARDCAEKYVQERYIGTARITAAELRNAFNAYIQEGERIREAMVGNDINPDDEKIVKYLDRIVSHSSFYKVLICQENGKAIDNEGMKRDALPYVQYYGSRDLSVPGCFFFENDLMGSGNTIVGRYPIEEKNCYVLFFFDINEASENLSVAGAEEHSFGVIFKKDGTILNKLNNYKDNGSKFLSGSSLLHPVQQGTSREEYNYFKAKLYGETGCAIESEVDGDKRTVCCTYLGIEDWYVGIGVRQYIIDDYIQADFKDVKSSVVKLGVVLAVFFALGVAFIIVNFTKSRERGRVLEDKADMDLLTELTNKAATERHIAEYMDDNTDGHGVLFIVDIDNFKKVNDTMGHAFGDTLLKTLGKQIRTEFRVTDIVGRTGGDEFMIFLKGINDDLIVEREANRLTRFFHDFKAGGDYVKYSATASIGAAVFPEDGKSFKDLYVSADQALYRAKKRGKNQLVFFNEEKYGKQS